MPGITTIIPCYQAEKTIRETLESLRAQSFQDWECIVIDDGSTDSSSAIVESLAKKDSRIKFLQQENAGPSKARNAGLKQAGGKYIHFLDSDDVIQASAYQQFLSAFENHPEADVIYCGWKNTSEPGEIYSQVDPLNQLTFEILARKNQFAIHSIMTKKEALDEVGYFDEKLRAVEDWDLWLRLSRIGKKFYPIQSSLASYRRMPGTLSKDSMQMIGDTMLVLDRLRKPDPRLSSSNQLSINDSQWKETVASELSYYLGRAFRQEKQDVYDECLKYGKEAWNNNESNPQWSIDSMLLGMNESESVESANKQLADHNETLLNSWSKIQRVDAEIKNSELSKILAARLFQEIDILTKQNQILNQTLWNRSVHIIKKMLGYS